MSPELNNSSPPAMLATGRDRPELVLDGVTYRFRVPTLYDPATIRRTLARQRVRRRPSPAELRVCALAGIAALAEATGQIEEGEDQATALEAWYAAQVPTDEDDIDEPDLEARGLELVRREEARVAEQRRLYPTVAAIEATLERHWPAYAELIADRGFYDDVSRIEVVRLLLVSADGVALARNADGVLTDTAYQALPPAHRVPLATFAFGLFAPTETQRKN